MRLNFSLILAVASVQTASTAARQSPAPLVSLATASKRAFLPNNGGAIADDTTTVIDAITSVPSGGDTDDVAPLSQAVEIDDIHDAPLIADIEMLSDMLADVVKKENPEVYDFYTTFRKLGMDRAANPDDVISFEKMKQLAVDISPQNALGVMKTFSIALNLVNAAEVHHRMRLVRQNERADDTHHIGPLPMIEDSIRGTMEILLEEENASPEKIFDQLITQKCEIVLTAHPTEVNRKTLIRKCEFTNELFVWFIMKVKLFCGIVFSFCPSFFFAYLRSWYF